MYNAELVRAEKSINYQEMYQCRVRQSWKEPQDMDTSGWELSRPVRGLKYLLIMKRFLMWTRNLWTILSISLRWLDIWIYCPRTRRGITPHFSFISFHIWLHFTFNFMLFVEIHWINTEAALVCLWQWWTPYSLTIHAPRALTLSLQKFLAPCAY